LETFNRTRFKHMQTIRQHFCYSRHLWPYWFLLVCILYLFVFHTTMDFKNVWVNFSEMFYSTFKKFVLVFFFLKLCKFIFDIDISFFCSVSVPVVYSCVNLNCYFACKIISFFDSKFFFYKYIKYIQLIFKNVSN
jgi:hypothetical protein